MNRQTERQTDKNIDEKYKETDEETYKNLFVVIKLEQMKEPKKNRIHKHTH